MAYTLVCGVVPVILLVIAVCMLISDFYFVRREKKNGINHSFLSVWFIARALKIVTIVAVAYLIHTLDPQFLQPRPENAPPADQYHKNAQQTHPYKGQPILAQEPYGICVHMRNPPGTGRGI